jgi:thiol-disulfide isomerase/thioredoxin
LQVWTEAQPILDREMDALRKASSMVGTAVQKWEYHIEGSPPISTEKLMEFAVAKPDRLVIKLQPDLEVYADGKTLAVRSKSMKQYVRVPQPDAWLLRERVEELTGGQIRSIPGEVVLRPGMSVEQAMRGIKTVERTRAGDLGDKPGQWVTGTGVDERTPGALPFAWDRWYSDADGLVYQVKQDLTASYQDQENRYHAEQTEGEANPRPPRRVDYARWTITYTREVNAEVRAVDFEFRPAKDETQVDALVWPLPGMREQLALIGKPAPAVSGTDLEGQAVSVRDLKGKVVVLDYWATWCGPCVAGLGPMQALKTRMSPRGVVFLGVNRDDEAKREVVRKFLGRRGIDSRQIMDGAQGPAARAFFADSIPCVVVIDAEGVVRDVSTGYLPGKEKELEAKLEKVLSGQPVKSDEEWARLRAQVEAVEAARKGG